MRKSMNGFHSSALAASLCFGMASPALAGTPAVDYDLTLVAETSKASGFEGLPNASLNNAGIVVFAAVEPSGNTSLHLFDSLVTPLVTSADGFTMASDPSLLDSGVVAFSGTTDEDESGLWMLDPGDIDPFTLAFDGADSIAAGQARVNNSGDLAFWTLSCVDTCATLRHRIYRQLDGEAASPIAQEIAEAGESNTVGFPAINDARDVIYRHVNADGTISSIRGSSGGGVPAGAPVDTFMEIESGLLSGPAFNNDGIFAVLAEDDDHPVGMYVVDTSDVALEATRVVALDGNFAPSLYTSARLNDADELAFAAQVTGLEGIFVTEGLQEGAPIQTVISSIDPDFEDAVFEAIDINDNGQVLFKALHSNGLVQLYLATPENDTCAPDLNGDDTVNVSDMLILLGAWGACPGCAADLNDDDVVNVSDLLILLGEWGDCPVPFTCTGDLNLDNVVNVSDMLQLLGDWGACADCAADLNDDDLVNVSDLLILLGVWGPCP